MKKESAAKFVSIYSIVIGLLTTLSTFGQNELTETVDPTTIVIYIALLAIGITTLVLTIKNSKLEKVFMIILLVFYSIAILGSLIILLTVPFFGVIAMLLFAAPFIISIIYLVKSGDEGKVAKEDSLTITLSAYKELLEKGMIDEEEYNRLVKSQLDGLYKSQE